MDSTTRIFKGLEFIGALVAASSIATLPDDEIEELLKSIDSMKKDGKHDNKIKEFTDDEKKVIDKYLAALKDSDKDSK